MSVRRIGAVVLVSLSVLSSASRVRSQPPPRPRPSAIVPGRVSRYPSTVTVLTEEHIRLSGARYLSDVLRMVPGMEVIRTSSTDSNVSFRGYNDSSSAAQGILVYIDGRQANNEFYGNAFWDTLPVTLDQIVKIEVIRGPSSFLFGPNAMHGLVNIITKSPLQYEADYVSLSTSNLPSVPGSPLSRRSMTPDAMLPSISFVSSGPAARFPRNRRT